MDNEKAQAALEYIRRGWKIFPLHTPRNGKCSCRKKDCASVGKHPRTQKGVKDATDDEATVRRWWRQWPDANIGLACGVESDVEALDVDSEKGDAVLLSIQESPFDTLRSITSKGTHHLFRYSNQKLKNRVKFLTDLDMRTDGGYIVLPPSTHESGHIYEWDNPDTPLATMPHWLIRVAPKHTDPSAKKASATTADDQTISEGERNHRLFRYACAMRKHGASEKEIQSAVEIANAERCQPPLDDDEISHIVSSSLKYEDAPPKNATKKKTNDDRYQYLRSIADQLFEKNRPSADILKHIERENRLNCEPPISDVDLSAVFNAAKPQLKTQTMSALLDKVIPEPHWAVREWIPEGLTILAGKPKVGKSFLALQTAIAINCGGRTLGEIECEQGTALYCALEDNERRIQSRIRTMLEADPNAYKIGGDYLHIIHMGGLPPMHKGGLDQLDGFLAHHPDTRIVIIDTLQKFKPPATVNKNAYEEDYDLVGQMQLFALQHNIALVLVHHLRKSTADYGLDEISGSTGVTGAADCLLILKRTHQGMILARTGRDVVENEYAVEFQERGCIWTLRGEAEDVHKSDIRKQILGLLNQAGEYLSPTEIAAGLEVNRNTIRTNLRRMLTDGVIFASDGKYGVMRV